MDDLKAGVYRHYKGPLYLVLGLAHDANINKTVDDGAVRLGGPRQSHEESRTVVVYIGLELDEAHTGPRLAVRTYDDFFALVHIGDGSVCKHVGPRSTWCSDAVDRVQQRFEYIGSTWEGER